MELKDKQLFRQQAYINGDWCDSADGNQIAVRNPSNQQLLGHVPALTSKQSEQAIREAENAWRTWRKLTARERSLLLRRWFDLVIENADDLAMIMTLEQGKPLAESLGEIKYAASFIEWYAEEARRAYGETVPTHKADARIMVTQQPIGVVAAITPWNFPAAMITRKAAPALAAGCVMLVKPSEETPYSALALAELADRAGIPAGVFNVLTGLPEQVAEPMLASESVRKLSFTGSTGVGKLLMEKSAATLKRVSLELGGNAPFIVFDDADLDLAITGVMASKFRNAGQTCVCANRILVQKGIYPKFVERLVAETRALKVADGLSEGAQQGPLINSAAVSKVEQHIEDAVGQGAELLTGGKRSDVGAQFFEPTVIAGVEESMRIAQEETFGPVAPVFVFETEDEAVAMANNTRAGLAAYFYSKDLGRAFRVSEALEYGMVGVNEGIISTEVAPFGGIKESGVGREGGHQGLAEYMETKYTLIGGLSQ